MSPWPRRRARPGVLGGAQLQRNRRRYGLEAPVELNRGEGSWTEANGQRYLDFCAGFGAAPFGQADRGFAKAICHQLRTLSHGLGDLYPNTMQRALQAALADAAPWPDAAVMLGLNGSDAIDAAVKTATLLRPGRPVAAFRGSYHGLMLGALPLCGLSEGFRQPFVDRLPRASHWLDWPGNSNEVSATLTSLRSLDPVPSALVLEPVLGRGGVHLPPDGFLAALCREAHQLGILVIADEILTGLGRCGTLWRSVTEGADVDMICTGKALGAGLPLSATLLRPEVAAAWEDAHSGHGALHTATYFGSPVCAAAGLHALARLREPSLLAAVRLRGRTLLQALRHRIGDHPRVSTVRGAGLLIGIALKEPADAARTLAAARERGLLALAAGQQGEVVQLVPPLNVSPQQCDHAVDLLEKSLRSLA